MYIDKIKVMSYHYPYRNGKELKQLELESKFESDRGLMIKKLLPLLEEYEDTLEGYHNKIEMTITIKPNKED